MPKDSLYNANIKKSKLYGVYIPRDVDDAMAKLMELTTEEARKANAQSRRRYYS